MLAENVFQYCQIFFLLLLPHSVTENSYELDRQPAIFIYLIPHQKENRERCELGIDMWQLCFKIQSLFSKNGSGLLWAVRGKWAGGLFTEP